MAAGPKRYLGVIPALAVVVLYAAGVQSPSLSASTVVSAPYRLLTYTVSHAGWLHVGANAAMLLIAAEAAIRLGGAARAAMVALAAAVAAGLIFCAATAALNPDATLEGASAVALALAAYDTALMRARIPKYLLGLLAVAMIFGPNAGGGLAHCAGFAVGLAFASVHNRRSERLRAHMLAERDRIRRKAEDSGYASLTPGERNLLHTPILKENVIK